MKKRNGFVSNSSSTAFIIDRTEDGAEEYIEEVKQSTSGFLDYGRTSCFADVEEIREYARAYLDDEYNSHAQWLFDCVFDLGNDIAFVRISDEEMGGWAPSPPKNIIYSSREWH